MDKTDNHLYLKVLEELEQMRIERDEAVKIIKGACDYLKGYSCDGKDKLHHNCTPDQNWHDPECAIARHMNEFLNKVSRE